MLTHRAPGSRVDGPWLLGLLATLMLAQPLTAQHVVTGRVVDAETGMPIEDVSVGVPSEGLLVGTDSAGFFRFEVPEDRPGVALDIEVIGFASFSRTWLLPLERPIVVGLKREAIALEGIDVEVERPGMSAREMLEYRVRSVPGGIPRTADAAALRAFADQNAEILNFFPAMTVATGAGCESCLTSSGRFDPDRWVIDDREVLFDEFRTYPVRDFCRLDVVTVPIPGRTMEQGFVIAYTCEFLRDVATGEETLPLLLTNLWGRE